jgi:hypothetical protein
MTIKRMPTENKVAEKGRQDEIKVNCKNLFKTGVGKKRKHQGKKKRYRAYS